MKKSFPEVVRALVSADGREPLSLRQCATLLVIAEAPLKDPATVRSIAVSLRLQDPVVTRAVDVLEAAGLVIRAGDAGDRRRVLLTATPAGKQMAHDMGGRVA